MIIVTEVDNLFNIDLSFKRIQFTEENNWFNDSLVAAYTLPEELPYNIDSYFLQYKSHNLEQYQIRYDVIVNLNGHIFPAKFELVDFQLNTFSFSIFYGSEQFPNWDKKLSDLEINNITISNINAHATTINTLNYPEAKYYFPLIHTDQYKSDNNSFANFNGSYNLRDTDGFVQNSIDVENNIIYNYNIIRPYFYWLHILNLIVEQAGYQLQGDVLNFDLLKNLLLISGKKFEKSDRPETIDWIVGLESYIREGFRHRLGKGWQYGRWEAEQEILHHGKFRIKGTINNSNKKHHDIKAYIKLDDTLIFSNSGRSSYYIDQTFVTKPSGSILSIYSRDYQMDGDKTNLQIIPIELYDANGDIINYVVDSNVIDFSLALPDATQGAFIQATMKWFNLDFTVNENVVTMNLKEAFLRKKRKADNWQKFEIEAPKRTTNLGDSFLLKFKNSDDENYPLVQTFVNQDQQLTENFISTENTTTIEIDVIPLPILMRNNMSSGFLYKADDSSIFAALRNTSSTDNYTTEMIEYLTPAIVDRLYKTWFRFRISTIQYNWEFKTKTRFINPFNIKTEKYCFGNNHLIKKIQRDIEDGNEDIIVETLILR